MQNLKAWNGWRFSWIAGLATPLGPMVLGDMMLLMFGVAVDQALYNLIAAVLKGREGKSVEPGIAAIGTVGLATPSETV
ncbi:hypothetical protein CCP1ISM_10047 [Azospirillaceae bacterium]